MTNYLEDSKVQKILQYSIGCLFIFKGHLTYIGYTYIHFATLFITWLNFLHAFLFFSPFMVQFLRNMQMSFQRDTKSPSQKIYVAPTIYMSKVLIRKVKDFWLLAEELLIGRPVSIIRGPSICLARIIFPLRTYWHWKGHLTSLLLNVCWQLGYLYS